MVYDVFVIRAMVHHVFMLFSEGKGQSVSCDNKHVIVSMWWKNTTEYKALDWL